MNTATVDTTNTGDNSQAQDNNTSKVADNNDTAATSTSSATTPTPTTITTPTTKDEDNNVEKKKHEGKQEGEGGEERKDDKGKDTKDQQQQQQSFTQAVFSGFNPPKISTPAFFSSMQGKIQSTLSGAKSPTQPSQAPQTSPTPQSSHIPHIPHIPQINKVDIKQIQASTEQFANTTKDWGVNAFKSLSNAAQRVSANVTQGIQKEHEEFLRQKKMDTVVPRQGTETLPVWAGLPNEEKIKAQILSLSKDQRNFLLPPPPGTNFVFDMNAYSSAAMATLKQDPNLDKMRFYLVPKEVEELVFWRNYFYRVSLLKQVALSKAAGSGTGTGAGTGTGTGTGEEGEIEAFTDDATEGTTDGSNGNNDSSNHTTRSGHGRKPSLGYNIYFGKDDVQGPPMTRRSSSSKPDSAN
ncbi:hypothetical protein BX616_003191, partial [Lobosporangium transversale]